MQTEITAKIVYVPLMKSTIEQERSREGVVKFPECADEEQNSPLRNAVRCVHTPKKTVIRADSGWQE